MGRIPANIKTITIYCVKHQKKACIDVFLKSDSAIPIATSKHNANGGESCPIALHITFTIIAANMGLMPTETANGINTGPKRK